ncbi:type II secretion system protein GspL [Sansalvadorimonas verongulae]|uniref:type II secretion system protein GspL n=1 Tax=Sansalvadorimonas verongulae TaxID=2172824 RepID=UPI0012BD3884|nr:type II secretion system protein GspL [Sansalvadorimonas verongulae]MTI14335.1 hypothetical protein [Sansalvadorimonas verongulae]
MIKTKTQLIVRLCPDSDVSVGQLSLEWLWVTQDGSAADDPESTLQVGNLEQLSQWWQTLSDDEQDLPVVLVVSGFMANSHLIHLQENQRRHWQQALPYLLEERLASDIESQHLVSAQIGDDTVYAACIGHSAMTSILQKFAAVDLDPVKVLSETQFLKGKDGELTVWLEGEHAFVASHNSFGQWLDRDALDIVVPGLLEDEAEENGLQEDDAVEHRQPVMAGMTVYTDELNGSAVQRLETLAGQDVPVSCEVRAEASLLPFLLSEMARSLQKRQLLDFRTGAFKCTRKSSRRWRQWRPVAVAAGLWLTIELLFNAGSGFYFQYQAQALRNENFSTYKELRPDDRRVVDVRHNLTRFLRDSSQQQSSADFLNMLKVISNVSDDEIGKGIIPKAMDFNEVNGRLSLDVHADSFELLNRYVDALKSAGLNARMDTGNQDVKGVSARLTVRRA